MKKDLILYYTLNETDINHLSSFEYDEYLKGIYSWDEILEERNKIVYEEIDTNEYIDIDIDNNYNNDENIYNYENIENSISIPIIKLNSYSRVYNSWDRF